MTGATRDISYAHTAETAMSRVLVRGLENATGRRRLILRARGYEAELAAGADFWATMIARFGLSPEFVGAGLEAIPREGPLVVVANHPFGILDGLMLGHVLRAARGDFRVLAHEVFSRAPELGEIILPIDFAPSAEAARANIATRKEALRYLGQGGAIGIFPGGTVSTPARPMGQAMDPEWRRFTAKMVARSEASVVPVFFEGQNSRLFHLASHVSVPLRMGLLIREFRRRVDSPVRAHIGPVIGPGTLAAFRHDAKSMMDFLRERTYALSPNPVDWREAGLDFEKKDKAGRNGSGNFR